MLFRRVTLDFQSGTVLMAIYMYSTLEGCKPKLRCRLMFWMSSSMQMIWIKMPAQRQKCKEPWIRSHSHLTISTKRQRLYSNQHLENHTMNQPAHTWKALSPEQCTHCQNCKSKCGIRKTPCKCLGAKWNQA